MSKATVDEDMFLQVGFTVRVARLLDGRDPEGILGDRIVDVVHEALRVTDTVPATGSAGDVYICHPFLAHSFNPVGPSKARVVSNVCVHGRGPIDIQNPRTPIARAIAQALG